jgi:flagellar M-ring protein FliF
MAAIILRIKDWWEGADRTQRLVTVFGGAFLALLLGLTFWFAGRPRFAPLFVGLSPADQGMVVEELTAQGIPTDINGQGAVMVPIDKVEWARMRLAQSNKLPDPGPKGMEWLDSLNSFSTPAQEREKIKAAKEGELARSIQTLEGIKSALVHISFGKDSPFGDEAVPPSAVVNITEAANATLSPDQGKAIARLVQNAVPGLKPDQVSVVNSAGQLVYDGEQASSAEAVASQKISAEIAEAKRRETDLQRRLDIAFGPGNTVAMVQVKLNMDAVTEQAVDFQLGDKKVTEKATETMAEAGATSGGPAGIESNSPASAPGTSNADGLRYSSEVTANQYPSTEIRTQTKKAAGELVGLTVSVIANSDKIEDPAVIQSILNDYLGASRGQEGFSASVQSVPFDTEAAEEQKKAAASAASQANMQQYISLLPVAALLVVGFMVTKALGKIPGKHLTMALPGGGTVRTPAPQPGLPGGAAALPPAQPEGPKVTTIEELAKTEPEVAEALAAMGVETIDESVDVAGIRQKIDVPLEQIKKMSRQKPQAVAMLLKGWLLEERR